MSGKSHSTHPQNCCCRERWSSQSPLKKHESSNTPRGQWKQGRQFLQGYGSLGMTYPQCAWFKVLQEVSSDLPVNQLVPFPGLGVITVKDEPGVHWNSSNALVSWLDGWTENDSFMCKMKHKPIAFFELQPFHCNSVCTNTISGTGENPISWAH